MSEQDNKASLVKETIEKRLKEVQKSKEFKDTDVVAYTKKYKRSFDVVTANNLDEIELDAVNAYKQVEKSKVWAEYNLQEQKEKGYSSGVTYLKVKCRESIQARPFDSKDARDVYVTNINKLTIALDSCFTIPEVVQSLNQFIYDKNFYYGKEMDLGKLNIDYYRRQAQEKKLETVFGKRFLNFCRNQSEAVSIDIKQASLYSRFTVEQQDAYINKQLLLISGRIESLSDSLKKAIDATSSNNDAFVISEISKYYTGSGLNIKKEYEKDKEGFKALYVNRFKRALDNEIKLQENLIKRQDLKPQYIVREDNWDWAFGEKQKVEKTKSSAPNINTKIPLDHIERKGGLQIPAVSVESITKYFCFNNVVFGNALKDDFSKESVRHFLGALSDLSEILDLDICFINQLGKLDINFATMGVKGHMATYFPSYKAINLTKSMGDGSVAHEWFHYFDNVTAEGSERKATNNFASELSNSSSTGLKYAFYKLKEYILQGGQESKEIVSVNFKAQSEKKYSVFGDTLEEAIANIQKMYPRYKFTSALKDKSVVNYYGFLAHKFNKAYISVPLELKTTRFYHNSALIGSDYWVKDVELFARAFEAYIQYKLDQFDRKNNYLVSYKNNWVEDDYSPYPKGDELVRISALFDSIFQEFKKEYNVSSFKPFTDKREDEFKEIELKEKTVKPTQKQEDMPKMQRNPQTIEEVKPVELDKSNKKTYNLELYATGLDGKYPVSVWILEESNKFYISGGQDNTPMGITSKSIETDSDNFTLFGLTEIMPAKVYKIASTGTLVGRWKQYNSTATQQETTPVIEGFIYSDFYKKYISDLSGYKPSDKVLEYFDIDYTIFYGKNNIKTLGMIVLLSKDMNIKVQIQESFIDETNKPMFQISVHEIDKRDEQDKINTPISTNLLDSPFKEVYSYDEINQFIEKLIEKEIKQKPVVKMQSDWETKILEANKYAEIPKKVSFTFDPKDTKFLSIIKDLAAKDNLRPVMNGVYFDQKEKRIAVTDAHLLLIINTNHSFDGIYPVDKKNYQKFFHDDKEQIEGTYPQFMSVVPTKYEYTSKVDLVSLLSYLQIIDRSNIVNKNAKVLKLSLGSNLIIGVNIDVLSRLLEAMIKLGVNTADCFVQSPDRAIVFKADKGSYNLIGLCMPMTIDESSGDLIGDIDLAREAHLSYDLKDNKVYANNRQFSYTINVNASKKDIAAIDKDLLIILRRLNTQKNSIRILDYILIKDKTLYKTDLDYTLKIEGFDRPDGLYEMVGNDLRLTNNNLNAADYPLQNIDLSYYQKVGSFDALEIKNKMQVAQIHAGKDNLRPIMKCIVFSNIDDTPFISASDAYSIYYDRLNTGNTFANMPKKGITVNVEQKAYMTELFNGICDVHYLVGKNVCFKAGDVSIYYRGDIHTHPFIDFYEMNIEGKKSTNCINIDRKVARDIVSYVKSENLQAYIAVDRSSEKIYLKDIHEDRVYKEYQCEINPDESEISTGVINMADTGNKNDGRDFDFKLSLITIEKRLKESDFDTIVICHLKGMMYWSPAPVFQNIEATPIKKAKDKEKQDNQAELQRIEAEKKAANDAAAAQLELDNKNNTIQEYQDIIDLYNELLSETKKKAEKQEYQDIID